MGEKSDTLSPAPLVERLLRASRRPPGLGSTPPGAISLAMGEPYLDTPEPIVTAAVSALHLGRTRYAPLSGAEDLRSAIARYESTRSGAQVRPENVVVTHGASAALAAVALTLIGTGERVVLPEPTYSLYVDHVAMAGGQVSWSPLQRDHCLDLEHLERALPGARMLILCTPGNPTGHVMSRMELESALTLAARHGVWVVVDEAYRDLVFDGRTPISTHELGDADRIITIQTFSKSYAMTGWRIGYALAPAAIADHVNLVHRTINGSIATFIQDAAIEALLTPEAELTHLATTYQERRDLVVESLRDSENITLNAPGGAFYAFPKIHLDMPSSRLAGLLAAEGVLTRAGSEYGPSGESHIRLSYSTELASLEEGLRRFKTTIDRLAADGQRFTKDV